MKANFPQFSDFQKALVMLLCQAKHILKLGSGNVQNVSRNGRVFFKNLSTPRPVTQEKFASIFTVIGLKICTSYSINRMQDQI